MRGKHEPIMPVQLFKRITPAYAGKTGFNVDAEMLAEDHPRVCGENKKTLFAVAVIVGSPPRMRGKLGRALGMAGFGRITPAYAGKTGRWSESGSP